MHGQIQGNTRRLNHHLQSGESGKNIINTTGYFQFDVKPSVLLYNVAGRFVLNVDNLPNREIIINAEIENVSETISFSQRPGDNLKSPYGSDYYAASELFYKLSGTSDLDDFSKVLSGNIYFNITRVYEYNSNTGYSIDNSGDSNRADWECNGNFTFKKPVGVTSVAGLFYIKRNGSNELFTSSSSDNPCFTIMQRKVRVTLSW